MEIKEESEPVETRWPAQLEIRVPFQPTAFPSVGRTVLLYELHLRNFGWEPLDVRGIEVLDPDSAAPVAVYSSAQLDPAVYQPVGGLGQPGEGGAQHRLPPGASAVVNLFIAFAEGTPVPDTLRHRVILAGSSVEGAVISTHHTGLALFGPLLNGANWSADDGPSPDSHHRGIVVLDGRAVVSRRYAIDWIKIIAGAAFSGDPRDYRAYHAYGAPVRAAADGVVISAKDGLPDNVPGHGDAFHPAVPITLDTIAGNTITLDVGGGQFAYYLHLQPGSVQVKVGDRVAKGQGIARLGCSGDSREPHLHFELTNSATLLAGEGLPYLIDAYRVKSADGAWQTRTHELPLKDMLIDFGERG